MKRGTAFWSANAQFLDMVAEKRRQFLLRQPCMLLFSSDVLTLYMYGGLHREITLSLDTYHEVKSVLHYAVLLHTRSQSEPADSILCAQVLDRRFVFDNHDVSALLLEMLTKGTLQHMELCFRYCAALYQSELHRAVQEMKHVATQDGEHTWHTLLVGISGTASPRVGHSAWQYFERLCGKGKYYEEHKKQRNLYYVENVTNNDDMRLILAQQRVEREVFDAYVPMTQDVLSRDTEAYLKTHCKRGDSPE